MKISGRIADHISREIYGADIEIENGRIVSVKRNDKATGNLIMPGFIDAHVHIESSMVTPGAFAAEAVKHGTIAVVADPHEIANVLGIDGVRFMIRDASGVPLKFIFGAPSCVPATTFESSGASMDSDQVKYLLTDKNIGFLSEMMNYPGVIGDDAEVWAKLKAAHDAGKPVDGHAPGLTGNDLKKYVGAGISTDHECSDISEAREKMQHGMKILIREGSAARNLEELHPLIDEDHNMVMLCSDDIHPDDLGKGHINLLFKRLLDKGYDLFDLINVACVNPVQHYNIGTGLLRVGDNADFIIVDNLQDLNIISTYIDGEEVYSEGLVNFRYSCEETVNHFRCSRITNESISVQVNGRKIRVIEVFDGQLITGSLEMVPSMPGISCHDTFNDILKIVVKERYNDNSPVAGFVKGFGLKHGALASSVAHDSHNIIAVGADDDSIVKAINSVVEMKGGLAWCGDDGVISLPLDIAGIISSAPVADVAAGYLQLTAAARKAGSPLRAPFMTLSFMALLVIPELKIGDRGLFDVRKFESVSLFVP